MSSPPATTLLVIIATVGALASVFLWTMAEFSRFESRQAMDHYIVGGHLRSIATPAFASALADWAVAPDDAGTLEALRIQIVAAVAAMPIQPARRIRIIKALEQRNPRARRDAVAALVDAAAEQK